MEMDIEKNVLIVGEDHDFVDFLALILEGEFQFNMIEIEDYDKACEEILMNSQNLVAVINLVHTVNVQENILYKANKKQMKLPFIQVMDVEYIDPSEFQDFFSDSQYNFVLPKQNVHKEILSVCEQVEKRFDLGDSKKAFQTKDGVDLFPIKIKRYLRQSKATTDIFIRIGAGKFIKLIRAGEDIDREKIVEYAKKGEKYLYQSKDDYEKAVEASIANMINKFGSKNLTKAEHIGLQLGTIKEVQDIIRNLGISESVIKATDEVVGSVEQVLKDSKNLKGLVKKLLSLKSSFFTRTSIMNYLLGAVCKSVTWTSHQTFKKLIYASIYCDFGFEPDEDNLATILSFEDDRINHVTSYEKKKIRNHPRLSAAVLEKTAKFLTDEISLILQHHEKPDGSGFPQGLNYKNTPLLSCMFILIYDFTSLLVASCIKAEDLDSSRIFNELPEEYQKGNYKKPYDALKKVLKVL
jgi:hypothetical protein